MILFFLILLICSGIGPEPRFLAAAQDECLPTSCNATGPIIRFPFRLKDRQPQHCGSPGFELSCNSNGSTEIEFQSTVLASERNIVLPISAKATVQGIDYAAQVIRVSILNGSCLPNRLPELNPSAPPLEIFEVGDWSSAYTLFNCSVEPNETDPSPSLLSCSAHEGFQVSAYSSASFGVPGLSLLAVTDTLVSLQSCVKMYNLSRFPYWVYRNFEIQLHWPEPFCGRCEAKGRYCRLKNDGTSNETECFNRPTEPGQEKNGKPDWEKIAVAAGVILTALALGALYGVYIVKKRKRENQRRIDRFLDDYHALRPTRYSYTDIKRITDGFEHRLGQGGYGTVYKGKLSTDVHVAVKVLNSIKGNGEEFINEVGTIGKIHHVNVVRLVGYCADGYNRALVYEFLENDSLGKYISFGDQGRTLGWQKLHQIALGIARGIDYLHQGCNQRILHFDIKPQNILLDHNLNPKVADFGLAKLCSKEKSVVTMTAARGTIGYIAPEVFSRNFGSVSYKSDIYSFGMLLLDMVGGRKTFDARAQDYDSEIYFPEWMYKQLEKGEDLEIQIEKDEENNIVKRLITIGLWCIQWYPADRPSMKIVIQMLEGENMPVIPPNPFAASKSTGTYTTSTGSLYSSDFDSAQTSLNSNCC